MKLRGKILSMVLGPAIVIGVTAIIIAGIEVKQSIQEQIKAQLKVVAYTGEEAYKQEEIASAGNADSKEELTSVIDTIYENGGVHVSVFEGDDRIASTVKDEKGNRVIGSKAPTEVVNTVLNQGKELFDEVAL